MIVWEESSESHEIMRARAGYNKDGVYHSWDARFYAVVDVVDGIATWCVDFYDEFRDRETGEYNILFSEEGEEYHMITAQFAVEQVIYSAIANEAQVNLTDARMQDEYDRQMRYDNLGRS
jgi:hypothetical protein